MFKLPKFGNMGHLINQGIFAFTIFSFEFLNNIGWVELVTLWDYGFAVKGSFRLPSFVPSFGFRISVSAILKSI
jgi:hypothetical protein